MSQGAPIDLTTPPPSPPRAPEDDEVQEVVKAESSSASNGKRRKTEEPPSQQDDSDDDCMEVDADTEATAHAEPTGAGPTFRGLGANDDEQANDDEELIFVGRRGDNALADFPHAREYCVTFKFLLGKELSKCANCYCYCCDAPAAQCTEWAAHCKATNTSHWWRAQREARKNPAGAAAAATAAAAAGAASSSSAAASSDPSYEPRWSCDKMLGEIQQVYPVERPEPAGLVETIKLRPYQKQSLAFMVSVEQSSDKAALGMVNGQPRRGGWLCDEVGMGKTAVVAALILDNPSTAKRISDEAWAREAKDGAPAPGEYKCTVVVVNNTLVQQTASTVHAPSRWCHSLRAWPPGTHGFGAGPLYALWSSASPSQAPVAACDAALISRLAPFRWADELKKFAPGLVVHTYYASSKNKRKAIEALRDADVLITTPHMNIGEAFLARVRLHRLVLDEAHLLNPGSTTAQKLGSLMRYQATHAWCVTGTPFSTSLRQLLPQAKLLGQDEAGICVNDFVNGRKRAGWVPPSSGSAWKNHWPRDTVKNDEVTALLRKAMIRHTKAMRIGGAVALALPDADVQTLWLDMSDDERRLYRLHGCADGGQYMLQEDHQRLKACSHLYAPEVVCGSSSSFRWQQRGAGSSGGPSKQLSQAEREALSLQSPAPYGQHAEATATFLRLHTHSVEAAPKLGARERRMQRMRAASKTGAGGEADEDAEGLPATVDVYTPNANLTKFRALLAELTELHGGPWTHLSPALPPLPCLLPPAPSRPPAASKGDEAAPTHRRGVAAAPYSRHGLPRAPRRDAAYRPTPPAPPALSPRHRARGRLEPRP